MTMTISEASVGRLYAALPDEAVFELSKLLAIGHSVLLQYPCVSNIDILDFIDIYMKSYAQSMSFYTEMWLVAATANLQENPG